MFTDKRFYLDYNATSKLSPAVLEWPKWGEFPFGNPSSVHRSGKAALREVQRAREFLFQTFGLDEAQFGLFFHSGASEGINTLLQGRGRFLKARRGQGMHLFYLATDHSCVRNQAPVLREGGHSAEAVAVDESGNFDDEQLIGQIRRAQGPAALNITWVNNESGVVCDLARVVKIKAATGCWVHVDAVQSVGKIEDWNCLAPELDAYTFSGHKFGALKGVGFSFLKRGEEVCPAIYGGGQQEGLRSGTENTVGILSLPLALGEVLENYSFERQREGKLFIERELAKLLGDKGEIVGQGHPHRNGNTVYFILYHTPANISSMALDLAGIDVSSGSACRSGAVVENQVLMAMGYSPEHSKNALRLSFSPFFTLAKARELWPRLKEVLARFV